MNSLSSGSDAKVTVNDQWLTVIGASPKLCCTHVLLQVGNGATFDWTLDGGKTIHHVLADPNGNPLRLALPGLRLRNNAVQIRRASATDLAGVWGSAW